MEPELIYRYSYGTEDILGAEIKIYKEENFEYTLIAEFTLFNKIALPKIKTIYKILIYEEKEQEEHGLITVKYKIKILAIGNPRPEKLFIIDI